MELSVESTKHKYGTSYYSKIKPELGIKET